jgi:hypothetical protein
VGHQFVVRGTGVFAGDTAVATDGVGVDLDQTCCLEDAAPFVDMVEDRGDLVLGQVSAIQRRALSFREPRSAGAAIEQAKLLMLSKSAGNGEISGAALAEVGAPGIQATERGELVHGWRWGLEREARTRLEALL